MTSAAIDYIKSFLLYGDTDAAKLVGYTANKEEWGKYKVIVVPEDKGELYLPDLNVRKPVEKVDGRYIIRKDIIYNTFFLISRAEELLNRKRDKHGRFLAEYSILGAQNNLLTPIIDEYSRTLMKMLELPLPKQGLTAVNLTHDIDTISRYRHLRGAIGGLCRGEVLSVARAWININDDPAFCFPWLSEADKTLKEDGRVKQIYFIKAGRGRGYDRPQYSLCGSDFRHLEGLLKSEGVQIGLHGSYESAADYSRIGKELSALKKATRQDITINRQHYLRSCEPQHFAALEAAGITDDYTMGFADRAGFRLGTTRPVRWIDPTTGQLTRLTLHPLTVMDCTLSSPQYMNLQEDEAYYVCQQLIDKTIQHAGELTLLWHNTSFLPTTYHKSLYNSLLQYIKNE